jgi:hypothetical protein
LEGLDSSICHDWLSRRNETCLDILHIEVPFECIAYTSAVHGHTYAPFGDMSDREHLDKSEVGQ